MKIIKLTSWGEVLSPTVDTYSNRLKVYYPELMAMLQADNYRLSDAFTHVEKQQMTLKELQVGLNTNCSNVTSDVVDKYCLWKHTIEDFTKVITYIK